MTKQQFDAGHDGLHIPLTCENHSELRWSCKKVALSLDAAGKYRYNQQRKLFFITEGSEECDCPAKCLYALVEP